MSPIQCEFAGQVFKQLDRGELSNQWSASSLTLVDFAAARNSGLAEIIDETSGAYPEMTVIGARPIAGTNFKQSVRTKLPGAAFVDFNSGAYRDKGIREVREFQTKPINSRWDVSKLLAESQEDPWEALMADEAEMHIISNFQNVCKQGWYGSQNDPKGFPGAHQIYDTSLTVDATGTVDAQKESVWFLRLTGNNVQFLIGNGMDLDVSAVRIGDAFDADGNPYTAYLQELMGNIGFKISNLRAVGRVKNCTKETGKSITGNLAADLIEKFPVGQPPTHAFMSSGQREAYRKSLITPENPEPRLPTEIQGAQIVVTDSIQAGHALEIA